MIKLRAPRDAVRRADCWFLGYILLFGVAARVDAADRFWRNPAGGTFSIGGNWFGGVPGAGDIAHFALSTPGPFGDLPPYTVSFSAPASNFILIVEEDSVVFDLNSFLYETTTTLGTAMQLGTVAGKTGQLTVLDGFVTLPFHLDLAIASIAGGGGSLTVGAGGKVIGTMDVFVGLNGAGGLLINNNGDLIANDVIIGVNTGSSGVATITGGGSSLISSRLSVGGLDTGTLSVTAGGRVESTFAGIGVNSATSTATATIDGVGSSWLCSGAFGVGHRGTMNITAGGLVQNVNGSVGGSSAGTVHVNGLNSRWINSGSLTVGEETSSTGLLEIANGGLVQANSVTIGESGNGTLNISSGGRVESTSASVPSTIGTFPGSAGTANIDGADSTWLISNDLVVGSSGAGTMNVTAGGLVQNIEGEVGFGGNGTVRVDGVNSRWINSSNVNVGFSPSVTGLLDVANGGRVQSDFLKIGVSGSGTLNIASGGFVASSVSIVGQNSGSTGTVTVAGAGSTWSLGGNLNVGGSGGVNGGVGTVRIQSGGTVAVSGTTNLHPGDQVILEGGRFSSGNVVFNSGQGTFQWTGGTFNVGVYPRTLQVPAGGVLDVGFGLGAATTTVHGGYNQSAGAVLEIEAFAFGSTATGMDHLTVTDTAVMGGQLNVKLNSGAFINPALNYEIMSALSIAGSFANVANGQRVATVDGLGSFVVNYGAGSAFATNKVVLSNFLVFAGLAGDYNNNGVVDAADYAVWRNNLGQSVTLPNDSTPGTVTQADYDAWRAHFGQAAGSGSGATGSASVAIPEPSTFAQLLLAAVGFLIVSRVRVVAKNSC